jgi:hypothetical protein
VLSIIWARQVLLGLPVDHAACSRFLASSAGSTATDEGPSAVLGLPVI